jgi:hypothetical protein
MILLMIWCEKGFFFFTEIINNLFLLVFSLFLVALIQEIVIMTFFYM